MAHEIMDELRGAILGDKQSSETQPAIDNEPQNKFDDLILKAVIKLLVLKEDISSFNAKTEKQLQEIHDIFNAVFIEEGWIIIKEEKK